MRNAIEYCRQKFFDRDVTGVEVGVHIGSNARDMLEHWPQLKKLYLVDIYIPQETADLYEKNKTRIHIVQMPSELAAVKLADIEFDFVYIDAAHDYLNVKKDLYAWFSLLKGDGVFCGHDYLDRDFGNDVIKAVTEFAENKKVHVYNDWFNENVEKLRVSYPNRYYRYEDTCDWWIDLDEVYRVDPRIECSTAR